MEGRGKARRGEGSKRDERRGWQRKGKEWKGKVIFHSMLAGLIATL